MINKHTFFWSTGNKELRLENNHRNSRSHTMSVYSMALLLCVSGPYLAFRSSRTPHRASVLTQKYIIISAERGWETRGWKTGVCKDTGEANVLPLSLSLSVGVFSVRLSCSALIFFYFLSHFTFFLLSGKFFGQRCPLSVI